MLCCRYDIVATQVYGAIILQQHTVRRYDILASHHLIVTEQLCKVKDSFPLIWNIMSIQWCNTTCWSIRYLPTYPLVGITLTDFNICWTSPLKFLRVQPLKTSIRGRVSREFNLSTFVFSSENFLPASLEECRKYFDFVKFFACVFWTHRWRWHVYLQQV